MRRLRLFFNFDKEEAWLNRMAADGHLLTRARLFYKFAPVTARDVVVRVDYRPSMSRPDFDDHVKLFEDSGWRHLDGSRHGGPQYFASFSADTNADIFSDAASKADRYRRSISTSGLILLPFLVVVIALGRRGTAGLSIFSSPKEWYLTPGLWEMHWAEFLRAFLFETPFVLFRLSGPVLLVGFCIYFASLVAYQYVLYRRTVAREDA